MRRIGQVIGVKLEHIEAYERMHATVWPEVLAMIHACNIRNYSIFRHGALLFAYMEYIGEDFALLGQRRGKKKMPEAGYTLITGASGFIGTALAHQLSTERQVVCLSRKKPQGDMAFVQGEFHSFEDLRHLDGFDISCVVHLASVTGGCSEEDGLAINVLGTRRLIRYAIDRGCRKFVMASSIAAVGCLSADFLPLQVPIPDDHPCLARDAYGLSKAMMEDLTRYFHGVIPDSDFISLRFAVVDDPSARPTLYSLDTMPRTPFVELGHVTLSDALRALILAVRAPTQPSVRVFNVVGMDANCSDPIPIMLRACLGPRSKQLDLSWYDCPEHAYDALYAMDKIEKGLGFSPKESTRVRIRERI
jgi:UDP-glucose 4-epimerase